MYLGAYNEQKQPSAFIYFSTCISIFSEAGYAVVDPIITVERDGAKEMHTLDLEGVRYQIVIEPEFVDDPNVDKTQDDGIDNEDLMTMELGMKIRVRNSRLF